MKDIAVGDIYKCRNGVTAKVTSLTDKNVTFVDGFGVNASRPRDLFAAEFLDEPYEKNVTLVIRDLRRECEGLKEHVETLERERDEARCEAAAAAAEANDRAANLAACLQDRFNADHGLRDAVALECLRAMLHPNYAALGASPIDAAETAYQVADRFMEARDRVLASDNSAPEGMTQVRPAPSMDWVNGWNAGMEYGRAQD